MLTNGASYSHCTSIRECLSSIVSRLLQSYFKEAGNKHGVRRGAINNVKDSIPPKNEQGVVYAVGCKTYPNVYIGETARTAATRIREHQHHTHSQHPELSGKATHVINEGHTVHWEPRIVARETNVRRGS